MRKSPHRVCPSSVLRGAARRKRLRRTFTVERLEARQLLALTIANLPAQDISTGAATVGVEVIDTGTVDPTITIYWGDEDGGTDVLGWDAAESLGVRPPGQHSAQLTELQAGTDYFFRAFALGLDEPVWADETAEFTTVSLPVSPVSLESIPSVGDSSAVVRGVIDGSHNLQSAMIYYGTTDGGEDPEAWQQTHELAAVGGDFRAIVAGLLPDTQYFLRLAAADDDGVAWSDPLALTTARIAPLRISEIMAANASTLPTRIRLQPEDSFAGPKNTYDWIEIQNATHQAVDLGGYYLSDQEGQPTKWQVPGGTVVPARGSIIVFASSKDIADPNLDEQGRLHTNFSLDRNGEYLSLSDPSGAIVHALLQEDLRQESDVSYGFFGNEFGPLVTPTPASANGLLAATIELPDHRFDDPGDPTSPLIVTAAVQPSLADLAHVRLNYRVMFEDEQSVSMADDGIGTDAIAGDGIFTGVVPGAIAQPGEMIRYYVSATDDLDVEARMPRFLTPNNSPEYFGTIVGDPEIDSQLPILHRFIKDTRRADTSTGTRASVYYDGEFYDNIYIRIRGGTARSWPKKSYKIEFNDEYAFRFREDLPRVDEFNLNTTYTDKSYVRAILAYELYEDSGSFAPITFPLRVEQNGEFFSVAHFVEQPDRDFLRRYGLDPDGALYKSRHDRLNGLTGRAEGYFEKKTRHAEDASDLQDLIDGLRLRGADLETFLFDHVDLPAQINLMAVNVILQNIDATDKNYYIYRDTEGNQEWKMLPWDLDLVLGPNALNTDTIVASEENPPAHTSHPYLGTLRYPFHGRKNHLFDAIVNSPRTHDMFLRRVRTLMDEFLGSAVTPVEQRYFENRIDELAELLGPDVLLDKDQWESSVHFPGRRYTLEEAVNRINNEYLAPRREHLFQTHSIDRLTGSETTVLIPEFFEGVEYFVPTDNSLGTTWTDRNAPTNADQWQSGQLGIGFENSPADYQDLIKTRVKPEESCDTCTSVFVRVPFSLENPSAVEHLTLRMKYDDGFVAYVNGVEVTRANTRVQENEFDSRARSHLDREAVEFENFGFPASLPGIGLGTENVLAVHLLNSSASSNDMLLSLELVDGLVADTNAVGIPNAQTTQTAITFQSYDQSPESGNQDEEYLELHNPGDEAQDISGWELRGGVTHRFRGGTVIPAGESLFATPDSLAFRNRATGPRGGMGLFLQDGYQGHLSSRGETVELVDPNGKVVASLTTAEEATDVQKYLRVTEVHYNPLGPEETTEFLELRNISDETTLDLNGVRVTDGPRDPFAFSGSQVTTLAPGAFLLIVNDVDAFTRAYPDVDPGMVAGTYEGSLSNGGETIKIEDAQNGTVLEFRYEDGRDDGEENWHVATDGDGYSLVIRNEAGPIEAWDTGMGWRPSIRIGGSPGEPDGPLQDVDFDNDGDVDADDLDLLSAGVRQADLAFDLNLDGVVDADDRRLMLSALGASVGDSNLDGVFNSSDMVMVFVAGQYEDDIPGNSGWAEGDWDGNGDFTTSDLVLVFQAGTYSAAAEVAPSELAAAVDFLLAQDEDLRRTRPSVQLWTP